MKPLNEWDNLKYRVYFVFLIENITMMFLIENFIMKFLIENFITKYVNILVGSNDNQE